MSYITRTILGRATSPSLICAGDSKLQFKSMFIFVVFLEKLYNVLTLLINSPKISILPWTYNFGWIQLKTATGNIQKQQCFQTLTTHFSKHSYTDEIRLDNLSSSK